MFTVKKVLNSNKAAPEYVYLRPKMGESYRAGTLLTHKDGQLVNCTATDKPTHLAVMSVQNAPLNLLLPAVPITPDVILETVCSNYPTMLKVGQKYTLLMDGSYAVGLTTTTEGGVATVVSNYGASSKTSKFCVKFE